MNQDDFRRRWAPTLDHVELAGFMRELTDERNDKWPLENTSDTCRDCFGPKSAPGVPAICAAWHEPELGEPGEITEDAAGKFQNPKGGLNDAGRKHFGVKKGVTNYSGASDEEKKRWVRWALRFTKTPRPLKDGNGKPTRYALMFNAWGEPVPTSPDAVAAVHKKAESRAKQLKMGQNAAEQADADLGYWDGYAEEVQQAESAAVQAGEISGGGYITTTNPTWTYSTTTNSLAMSPAAAQLDSMLNPALNQGTGNQQQNAFVADVNGRTFVAAPASAIQQALRDPTVEEIAEEHMLWIDGRFVGAEEPNRNGAMWSAGDLELARGTVLYGPLNWLHEARHVIGSMVDAKYVDPRSQTQAADVGGKLPTVQPHITATAAVWKWIWPDEAYVIQQASDLNQLWYSMECISKEVACSGPDGCGHTTSYSQYLAGAACEHIRQRASVRQFKNPIFLGGAVIVPPTRPGWAEADVRVMKQASGLAEAAFEQAGRPDVSASTWEQMMAQLVRYSQK